MEAILNLTQNYQCEVSHWDRSAGQLRDAPAYDVTVSSSMPNNCKICVYFDDPPTVFNLNAGAGWRWIESWTDGFDELMDECLFHLRSALEGKVVERLVYSKEKIEASTIAFSDGQEYGDVGTLVRLLPGRRQEVVRYDPYPQIGSCRDPSAS